MAFLSGYGGSVEYDAASTILHVKEWRVRMSSDEADVTHALPRTDAVDKGFVKILSSLRSLEGSLSAVWCTEDNPFKGPVTLTIGATTDITLYLRKAPRVAILVSKALIMGCEMGVIVRGAVEYSLSFKANGYFSYPTNA